MHHMIVEAASDSPFFITLSYYNMSFVNLLFEANSLAYISSGKGSQTDLDMSTVTMTVCSAARRDDYLRGTPDVHA